MPRRIDQVVRRRNSPEVKAYLEALEPPIGPLARRARTLVRTTLPDAKEGIWWAVPFFFLEHAVCYVSAAKRHVTFGFVRGTELRDPRGLLKGTDRSPIRKVELKPGAPVPEAALRDWLRQAARLDRAGYPE